jgi:hypothetical protein
MPIERKKIESSLLKKGFTKDKKGTHHRYFYHEYQGLRTDIFTFTSHGSKYKTYSNSLLKKMKRQLHLDNINQLEDLINCPLSGNDYNKILENKNKI